MAAVRLRYDLLDVFTDEPFGGNPLAVFLDADGLDATTMQRIAAELNLSETVFLTPAGRDGAWRARIFTPAIELPFAGHPTIGAALALHRAGRLHGAERVVLDEETGSVPVTIASDGSAASLRVPTPPDVRDALPTPQLADMLGLGEEDVLEGAWRPRAVSCGVPFHMVALASRAAVSAAKLRLDLWRAHLSSRWAAHLYVFAAAGTYGDADFHARMFAPAMGVAEDPATGGAAAALAGFLAAARPEAEGAQSCIVEQGVEMGRPSRLFLRFDASGGVARDVHVGGAAVSLGGGHLDLGETTGEVPTAIGKGNAEHYSWGDGCDGWRLLDGGELAVIRERMPPGRSERRHRHRVSRQLFFTLSGTLEIDVGERSFALAPGEALEVVPGAEHGVHNRSGRDVEFLVISSPPTRNDRIDEEHAR